MVKNDQKKRTQKKVPAISEHRIQLCDNQFLLQALTDGIQRVPGATRKT